MIRLQVGERTISFAEDDSGALESFENIRKAISRAKETGRQTIVRIPAAGGKDDSRMLTMLLITEYTSLSLDYDEPAQNPELFEETWKNALSSRIDEK